jgi:NAD(P)-dependent dehydrogenase (short-subunit alcohol dehydrogenase family)
LNILKRIPEIIKHDLRRKIVTRKLEGKVAVITGAGGGIGGEIAKYMAAEGAKIVVNDFGKDADGNMAADKVVLQIQKAKGVAVASFDSVATVTGGANIINTAISNFGRIDILVNTAGAGKAGKLTEVSEKDWDLTISVHLKGHFSCSKAAAEEMIKQKSGGRIINFSSNAGFTFANVPFFDVSYATAKAGIVGFTAKLSGELRDYGITVNAIFPSAVTKGFPDKRPGADSPEYIAPIVVYLATDDAKNITGQLFTTYGGNIGIYPRPIQKPSMLICKSEKWTLDELERIVPTMVKPD